MTVHAQTPILCNLLYSIGDFVLKFGFIKSHFKNRIPRFNISYLNTKQSRLSTLSFCITISPEGTGFHLSNIKPAPSGGLSFIAQQARPLGRAFIYSISTAPREAGIHIAQQARPLGRASIYRIKSPPSGGLPYQLCTLTIFANIALTIAIAHTPFTFIVLLTAHFVYFLFIQINTRQCALAGVISITNIAFIARNDAYLSSPRVQRRSACAIVL